jgi:hypothetical protein
VITIPTGDLTGVLADVIPFAMDDDGVPDINCVRLEWNGSRLDALATDSHRVACSQWVPGDIYGDDPIQDDLFTDWGTNNLEPWALNIGLDDAKELVKVFKLGPKERSCPLTIDYDPGRNRLTINRNRDTGHSAITIAVDGTSAIFPDVRAWLAKNDVLGDVREVAFTALSLADFAKVRPQGPLDLRFTGPDSMVHVAIGERFFGAIMPVRIGGDR